MKKKLAFINTQMEKGKFSQNTTRFKDKSKNIQPIVIDTELVNSLIGDETNKAPTVAAVNKGLEEKITEEQAKKIAEDAVKNIEFPKQVQADWLQNSASSADYIKNKPPIKQGSGNYSIEEGSSSNAIGANSHAEGNGTISEGAFSHSEGNQTYALAQSSHTEGYGTKADYGAPYAHAEGLGTIAKYPAQHVQGKYNIPDPANKYAHIVGNGVKEDPRNIHTLDWNGNAWFDGDIYVGGLDQFDGKKLATEEYVNSKISDSEIELYKVDAEWHYWRIPNNAGKFFYIGTTKCDYSITVDDQPAGGMSTSNISGLEFYTGEPYEYSEYISKVRVQPNSFCEIPENADYIMFNEELPGWDAYVIQCPPLYFLGVKTNE